MKDSASFLLISSAVLPEIFDKVVEAKELLASGAAHSAAEASRKVGISRSAFYKYRDAVYAYHDAPTAKIISIHAVLADQPGVLSQVIGVFYTVGANILTVNQNIPIGGSAMVAVSANVEKMVFSVPELMERLRQVEGVQKIESITGN